MSRLIRKRINKDIEKQIITAFIVSDSFCKKIKKSYRPEYLEIEYARVVSKWSLDYFNDYDKAPGIHIEDIFKIEKETIKEEQADLIEIFLETLSNEYEREKSFNVDFLVTSAKDYFERRSLEIFYRKGDAYVSAGKVDRAKKLFDEYKNVAKSVSKWFNPFSDQEINTYDENNTDNRLFQFPGALGQLFGWFERGQLLAVLASEKRGKSYFLEELVFQALINRLKVAWISLEMTKPLLKTRIYQRLTALPKEEGEYVFPIFDCLRNQDDSCKIKYRTNDIGLYSGKGELPEYSKRMGYKVCTYCRGRRKSYVSAYWFNSTKVDKMMLKDIKKKSRHFNRMFGNNLRVLVHPRFSASADDISSNLDDILYTDSFEADVVVLDYIDILSGVEDRFSIDKTWKQVAGIAGRRNCLVVTADQGSKASRLKKHLDDQDTTEDKRKDAHLDKRIGLSQTVEEKEHKVIRANVLFDRENDYSIRKEVMILRSLDLGQPLLDSEWWWETKK